MHFARSIPLTFDFNCVTRCTRKLYVFDHATMLSLPRFSLSLVATPVLSIL